MLKLSASDVAAMADPARARAPSARALRYRALVGTACALAAGGDYDGACTALWKAIELWPEQPGAYCNLADALLRRGRTWRRP